VTTMVIDLDRGFKTWSRSEVWTGPTGTGQFVPNLNDLIFDVPNNTCYKTTNVDYTSGLSQWERFTFASLNGATDTDVLIGIGPGADSETWRLHVSKVTIPFEARFDLRLVIPGSEASYIKVFKMIDNQIHGNVISAMYDSNDDWVTDAIPIIQGPLPGIIPNAFLLYGGQYRTVSPFYLTHSVETGEPLYVKVYNAAGIPISEYRVLAHVTDNIPSGNLAVKHVSNITLETRFLSETVSDLIQVPKNINLASLVLMARTHYSTGATTGLSPVDGTKFTLLNGQSFIAGIDNQIIPVRLKYTLGGDESGDGVVTNSGERFITRLYRVQVMPTNYSYSVKTMNFLDWDSANNRYNMVSYLYSLDRLESFNVSDINVFGVTGDVFTGIPGSGDRQHVISVDLEDISPSYNEFRYIQDVECNALASGTSGGVRWRITNNPGETPYEALIASVTELGGNYIINLGNGLPDLATWLENTYEVQGPLLLPLEAEPLVPTHIRLTYASLSIQVPIANWNAGISIPNTNLMTTGRLVMVDFILIDGPSTFVLGGCGFSATVA